MANFKGTRLVVISLAGVTALAVPLASKYLRIEPVLPVSREVEIASLHEQRKLFPMSMPVVLSAPDSAEQLARLCTRRRNAATWQPATEAIQAAERALESALKSGSLPLGEARLENYVRQYTGIIAAGSRAICLSAVSVEFLTSMESLCDSLWKDERASMSSCKPGWWRREPIEVKDGGEQFWRITFHPDSGKFSDFNRNGQ